LHNAVCRSILLLKFARLLIFAFLFAGLPGTGLAGDITAASPLPNPEQLRLRALDTFQKTEEQREHYLCEQTLETQELKSNGTVKETDTQKREIFFVNGYEIATVVSENGKPLSAGEAKKQDEHVRKSIERYQKAGPRGDQSKDGSISVRDVLRLMHFNNEKREFVNGKPTIYFDVSGDTGSKTADIAQRAVQAMEGSIRIDEKTGTPIDIDVHSVRDVKVGGGLVASVHKGFLLHVQLAQRPDGVWLIDRAAGSGDARVGLLFHPYFRFKQQTGACKLFNASADDLKGAEPTNNSK
jgi:hypothetical protein